MQQAQAVGNAPVLFPIKAPTQEVRGQAPAPVNHASEGRESRFDEAFAKAQSQATALPEQPTDAKPTIEEVVDEAAEGATGEAIVLPILQLVVTPDEALPADTTPVEADLLTVEQETLLAQDLPMDEAIVSIPERPAQEAEVQPLATPPQDVDETPAMDGTASPVETEATVKGETSARMPKDQTLFAQVQEALGESVAPTGDSSSFENTDTGTSQQQAPPPGGVEISQIATAPQPEEGAEPKVEPAAPQGTEFAPRASSIVADIAAQEPELPTAVQQVIEEAEIQFALGKPQFTMKLRPEALGEVTVRLTMLAEGIAARIITRSDDARQAIQAQLATLQEDLRGKGIDVRSVEVLDQNMGQASLLHDGKQGGHEAYHRQPGAHHRAPQQAQEQAEAVIDYENWLYGPNIVAEEAGVEYHA